jgi:hypothetical protein
MLTDHRDGHRSHRHSPPSHRRDGYPPPRPVDNPPAAAAAPTPTPTTAAAPVNPSGPPNTVVPRPNFDPEYVPRGRAYFEVSQLHCLHFINS